MQLILKYLGSSNTKKMETKSNAITAGHQSVKIS